ncbi:methyl-accepting chemotaxis protein [Aromatoleum sp.]|uniref:methyl-accepting chemotaxis protein n=1 Tax=Aromatoleum sp. TaxID=2307007 RepID=UPI002FCB9700
MFKNSKISTRLAVLIGALVTLLVVTGLAGLQGMAGSNARLKSVYDNRVVPLVLLGSALDDMHTIRVLVLGAANAAENAAEVDKRLGEIPRLDTALGEKRSALLALPMSAEEKGMIARIDDGWGSYVAARADVIEAVRGGDRDKASEIMKASGAGEKYNDAVRAVRGLMDMQAQAGAQQFEGATAEFASTRAVTVGMIVAGVLFGVAIATWVIRSITRPLQQAVGIADRIAQGNLDGAIPPGGRDEIGQLLASLRTMRDALSATVTKIRAGADELHGAADLLSAASTQVAASSAEQSNAAAGVAAAIEQMTVSIEQVSASAADAESISRQAGSLSDQGSDVIHGAVAEMANIAQTVARSAHVIGELEQKSGEISAIINVIQEIADQTNLLALNAAIEAARAGEQGRGFAVVADEVRKLAERTSQSTREIAAMIDTIQNGTRSAVGSMETGVRQANQGVTLANQAGEAITSIKGGAAGVVHAVREISLALKEQSAASNEVAMNVARINEMSEENSEATRQTAAAAQSVAVLAGALQRAVGHFEVDAVAA